MLVRGFSVFLVEDDPSVRDALGLALGLLGYSIVPFSDAEGFLSAFREDWRGCLLVDIRMPGIDGLSLQQRLFDAGVRLPVIVMSGHADVDSARRAFRAQAVDFLEKPLDHTKLVAAIEEAFERQATICDRQSCRLEFSTLEATLTPRERQIMYLVIEGYHNRHIAEQLGISPRTVEVHKARIMDKMRVDGVPGLVRLVIGCRGDANSPLSVSA